MADRNSSSSNEPETGNPYKLFAAHNLWKFFVGRSALPDLSFNHSWLSDGKPTVFKL